MFTSSNIVMVMGNSFWWLRWSTVRHWCWTTAFCDSTSKSCLHPCEIVIETRGQGKKGKCNHLHLAEQKLWFRDINLLVCHYPKSVWQREKVFQKILVLHLQQKNIVDRKPHFQIWSGRPSFSAAVTLSAISFIFLSKVKKSQMILYLYHSMHKNFGSYRISLHAAVGVLYKGHCAAGTFQPWNRSKYIQSFKYLFSSTQGGPECVFMIDKPSLPSSS